MFHLIVGKKIVNNLYNTLVITVDCSRGQNMKAKISQNLVNPYCFSTYLNGSTIFFFYSKQSEYLLFLVRTHQRSSSIVKHIARSEIFIIIITIPVRVSVAD
jgi:hypothetical protein